MGPPGSSTELQPSNSPRSSSTTHPSELRSPTTPSSSPPQTSPPPAIRNDDDEDDVWGSFSPLQTSTSPSADLQHGHVQSDMPLLRRTHVTAGYREGLSISKAKSMQGGFDEGFPLGAEAGLRVGYVMGVLEGLRRGLVGKEREEVDSLLKMARRDLTIKEVVDVRQGEDEDEVGGDVVGVREEGILRWEKIVKGLLEGMKVG